ncbi:MAG: metalloregulator ArsR/SmtB family transcription factor [Pseudomonadota bacterium]
MSNYRIHIERTAERFKALSNPHRLALFQRLTNCCTPGTACELEQASQLSVGQLGEEVDIAPSTLSHHLKELNRAGLVQMERRGKQVVCWVEAATLKELATLFTDPLNTPEQ